MNAWTRTNLVLAGLAVVLLALELWPGAGPARHPLTGLDTERINAVRIERDDRLQLALRRHDDGWRMTHPTDSAARPRRVAQLLGVARAQIVHDLGDADLARYGLESPKAVLRLDALTIAFGDTDPTRQGRYVAIDGAVRVIDDVYYKLLTLPPRHFRGD